MFPRFPLWRKPDTLQGARHVLRFPGTCPVPQALAAESSALGGAPDRADRGLILPISLLVVCIRLTDASCPRPGSLAEKFAGAPGQNRR